MPFVLDASITLAWAFADENEPVASRAKQLLQIDKEYALAPPLWWYEVRNSLLTGERRGRISQTVTTRFLQQIAQLQIFTDAERNDLPLLDLARQYNLTAYDAAYLALAVRERLPLATLDRALAAAAKAEGIPSLA